MRELQLGPAKRRWHEPVRIGLTVLWVGALSFWSYYQVLFLSGGLHTLQLPATGGASLMLRTVAPLWLAGFFPALAVGLAWYVFSQRLGWRGSRGVIRGGLDRLTTGQIYMSLCTALCLYLIVWRILPFFPMLTGGWHRASGPALSLSGLWRESWAMRGMIEPLACLGALGAGLAFLQAYGLVRLIGGRRRNLVLLAAALLAAGLVLPWSGVLRRLPSPLPPVVRELDHADPLVRGLLLGDPRYREGVERRLARYFETHDDLGHAVTARELRRGWLDRWGSPDDDDARYEARYLSCELCQLPAVGLWTMSGLPVLLDGGATPSSAEPARTVEIPRRGTDCRVYELDDAGRSRSGTLEQLPQLVGTADWIVLKIDWLVPMPDVLRTLAALRAQGVVRVDLAVISYGYAPMPPGPTKLFLDGDSKAASYQPRREPGRGNVIVVKKYIPPDGWEDPRQECGAVDFPWTYQEAWRDWLPEPLGSLPESLSIEAGSKQPYGKFVGVLQNAIAGGARQIHVAMGQEDE